MKIEVTAESGVVVDGLGLLTGTVEYHDGFPGSYWEPPEDPEVEEIKLRDAMGILVPEEFWENEDNYQALLKAIVDADARYHAPNPQEETWDDDDMPF